MVFAQLLVGAGLILLLVGLAIKLSTRRHVRKKTERAPLFKPEPGDWKDSIYTPKGYRKPKP